MSYRINTNYNLLIILIALILIGCKNKMEYYKKSQIKNMLLFVEDPDGKGGLADFTFGDFMLYDLKTQKKYRLTEDIYYDTHGTYVPDRHSIIFESKREKGQYLAGLSQKSTLYEYDLKSQITKKLNIPPLRDIFHEYMTPSYCERTKTLVFVKKLKWNINIIMSYNFENGKINYLDTTKTSIFNISWSDNGEYLSYEYSYSDSFKVGIIDLRNRKKYFVTNIARFQSMGNIRNGKIILIGKYINKPPTLYIKSLNGKNINPIKIKEFPQFNGIYSAQWISDKKLVFIGYIYKKKEKKLLSDIYLFELDKNNLIQLTNDGHIKECLVYIE
jgi:hypothetical protein